MKKTKEMMDATHKRHDKSFKDGDPCVYCMQPGKLNKRGVCEYCEDPYGVSALMQLVELEEAILREQE